MRVHTPWDVNDHGLVVLRRRKFGPIGTFVMRVFRLKTEFTVKMDRVGSAVWLLIDGQRTAGDILDRLKQQFPEEEDLAQRLGQYLSSLASTGFMHLT